MTPLLLSSYTATSCIGRGLEQTLATLRRQGSGLQPCNFETADLATWIGEVPEVDEVRMREDLSRFNCRNNRLAQLGLVQDGLVDAARAASARLGPERIGVFIGTSTAGILETELAYRRRDPATGALPPGLDYASTHSPFSVADFVRRYLGLAGPVATISSACSSSAKVFASAARMMKAGLIDAAVVGGVDSLCLTTLYGFNSLELTSAHPCRPFDAGRDGISIGEGAAFALLERAPATPDPGSILLLGVGESSDAYHMSSPRPDGLGARLAMEGALAAGGVAPAAVDYINLHGTATPSNDAAEGNAVAALFGRHVACSSTKGATGHALGAAGGIEAVITALSLRHGFVPAGVNTRSVDAAIAIDYVLENRTQAVSKALSNSFGFGGTNCSLLLGRAN
ncbi:MAG: beta-ketoacyl-[acyl-carrier-protein] synthase family protein [Betaproteobacteria bacterium]|nr:beta-ketoacyl-[acyl-carrier-protein] synthase family protein [Betaproteobacteria bacterium]